MTKSLTQIAAGTLLSYPAVAQTTAAASTTDDIKHVAVAAGISIISQLFLKLGNKLIDKVKTNNARKRRAIPLSSNGN